jgi:hypothetical protein
LESPVIPLNSNTAAVCPEYTGGLVPQYGPLSTAQLPTKTYAAFAVFAAANKAMVATVAKSFEILDFISISPF